MLQLLIHTIMTDKEILEIIRPIFKDKKAILLIIHDDKPLTDGFSNIHPEQLPLLFENFLKANTDNTITIKSLNNETTPD